MTMKEVMELWERQNGVALVELVEIDETTSVNHSKFLTNDEFNEWLSQINETA